MKGENKMKKINERKSWGMYEVRNMCVKHEYYTAGDCEAYEKILNFVEIHKPTTNNIYKVANDIFEHSDIDLDNYGVDKDEMVAAIMFDINNECVKTRYRIENA